MRLLLDSHILLWAMAAPKKLSGQTKALLEDGETEAYVSAATIWELRLKESKGKLRLPKNFETALEEENFIELPIKWIHAKQATELPPIHQDPFDRILIAQASKENLVLATQDQTIREYSVATIS